MYLSIQSAGDPYASIQITTIHFYNGERPILPTTSDLIWKYSSGLLRALTIRINNCRRI